MTCPNEVAHLEVPLSHCRFRRALRIRMAIHQWLRSHHFPGVTKVRRMFGWRIAVAWGNLLAWLSGRWCSHTTPAERFRIRTGRWPAVKYPKRECYCDPS